MGIWDIGRISDIYDSVMDIGINATADKYNISIDTVKRYIRHYNQMVDTVSKDIIVENVKLAKKNQKLADINRIERKAFREHARIENAILEYNKELIQIFRENSLNLNNGVEPITENGSKSAGIVHISDTHLNELVNMINNKYDFEIASKRLQMFIYEAKRLFVSYGVRNILVAFTGDLLNSDRRLDELLNQATNRSKATFLAVDIFSQALIDLSSDYNIVVASVSGNESRVSKDFSFGMNVATDNYDYTIYNILRYIFHDNPRITFLDNDPTEDVINVGGKNVLITHGIQLQGDVERKVIQLCGRWNAKTGQTVDLVLFGHMHYARIGDHFARSSSLVGANEYSDVGLQLISKASQNIHIITNTGQIHSIKIDLQNPPDIFVGYKINTDLVRGAYNTKAHKKLHQRKTIFEVVI